MKKTNQTGFAVLEFLLLVVIAAAVAIIGLRVVSSHKDTQASTAESANTAAVPKESSSVETVPQIDKSSDLDKASSALDQNDNSAEDNHDSGTLNSQAEDF